MSTYRLFQSPEGNVVRVKQGFSFQAFFVGSLTTLVRRYWWVAVLAGVAAYGMGFFTRGLPDLGTRGIALAAALGAVCLLYMLFCGFFGNRWLAESLRRRGFRMVGEEHGGRRPGSGAAPASRTARAGTSPSP